MKIVKNYKKININNSFSITGTNEELLMIEEILQSNGIKNDEDWNKKHRHNCNVIFFDHIKMIYEYHNHNCDFIPIKFVEFIKINKLF